MGLFNRKKPSNKRRPATATIMDGYREDFMDYESQFTGQPQRFGDTRPVYTPLMADQDYELIDNIIHKNGIAHKVVTKPAQDATRNGWRIIYPNDPKKQEQYQKALDALDLKRSLCQELIYYYAHGDAYGTIGIYSPMLDNNTAKPFDPKKQSISNIAFFHVFGQNHVQKIEVNDDPTDINYMKEAAVVINQTKSGDTVDANGTIKPGIPKTKQIVIDKSRYFHISLDKFEDDDTGNSIITRCWDQIHVLDTALYSVGKLLYAYDINVLTDDGAGYDPDDPVSKAEFDQQNKILSQNMGTDSILNLHNGQTFQRFSNNVSGIENLLTFAWQQLAAASNIPKSVLLGEQAGTLAGAATDVANYYDGVKSLQEELLRPQLERIIELLMWSTDVAGGSEDPDSVDWKLVFNPLWSADDKTQSETFQNTANAVATLVNSGIKDTDEANQMVDGQNNNAVQGMQTQTKGDSIDNLTMEDAKKLMAGLQKVIHDNEKKSSD